MSSAQLDDASSATGKPPLTRQRIVAAAFEVLDEDGPDALNMRRVAAELGTGQASLYRHVANRDDLLAAMLDQVLTGFDVRVVGDDWRSPIRDTATQLRSALLAQPGLLAILPPGLIGRLEPFRGMEDAMSTARRLDFDPVAVAPLVSALYHLVFGFALLEARGQIPSSADREELRSRMASLPADEFPEVTAAAADLAEVTPDEEFELLVEVFLLGVEHRFQRPPS